MRSRTWRTFAVLACVTSSACVLEQADSSEAETTAVNVEPIIGGKAASAYPEAVYLNIDMTSAGGYACTGTIIAPTVVLTAGHCIDAHKRWEVYGNGTYRLSTKATTYDWAEHGVDAVNPAHHDVGLIFLDDPIQLATYPKVSSDKAPEGADALNIGRVLDGDVRGDLYLGPTKLFDGQKVGFPLDYLGVDVIQPGDSGGPVMLAGTHTIVAVASGAGSGSQVLARVDLVASWIRDQVATGGGAPTKVLPGGNSTPPTPPSAPPPAREPSSPLPSADAGTDGPLSPPRSPGSDGGASGGSKNDGGAQVDLCTPESEPNNDFARSSFLAPATCGMLESRTDADWYSFVAKSGTTILQLSGTGDARFSVGAASRGTCRPLVEGVRKVQISVLGGTKEFCVRVTSASHQVQTYRLARP